MTEAIPSLYNAVNGGSTLNGCTPVKRINRGSRGTWLSGVILSASKMSTGFLDGGGSGISLSDQVGTISFMVISPSLKGIISCNWVCAVIVAMM